MTKNNYLHIVPNSHFWTDLNQLLEYLKYKKITNKYLKIGLENTLENGYNLRLKMKEYGEQEYKRGIEDGKIIQERGTVNWIE